ncbi:MAG: neutral/alkaline non-lysosomal ceramidase N-terminal domain-containing protein [Chloroflexi bacterium]|nr:neutral/alkaline non-lysosomal ceramidase N-terminal domain-containing protein [Chloroflexota bacterium]
MTSLRAGAATVDITPPVGGLMDGYGARRQPSQGVHDPLMARVLALDYGGPERQCAIVSCDLLGMHPWITAEVRRLAAEGAGIPPQHVIVAATHDHAGPAGLRGGMFSRLDEEQARLLAERLAGAIASAHAQRRPAALRLGQAAVDTVSMNRRHPDWPIDPVLRLLLIEGDDGAPVASLMNFACHATVLNATNLMLSGEFPGAACRLIQEQTGAPCVYLNGACGNVNPVWVHQDFDSVERVGQIIGGQALRLIGELRTLGPGQRAHNIRWDEFPEKPVPGRAVEPRFGAVRREIDLPLRSFFPDEQYTARIEELEALLAPLAQGSDERREVMAQLTRTQNERWAAVWARRTDAAVQRTEVQALALGEGLALLALPGEFFVETAEAIHAACGLHTLLVACYANDYIGYVIPPDAYEQGGYEAGVTFCPPEAEAIIVDASLAALRAATDHAR